MRQFEWMIYLKEQKDCYDSGNGLLVNEIGEKAVGLLSLPHKWVPPFCILITELFSFWSENSFDNMLAVPALLPTLEALNKRLQELKADGYTKIIVRSSGSIETIDDRGNLESHVCNNDLNNVVDAIEKVYLYADEFIRDKQKNKLALIIQGYKTPHYSGHLSNERRIARNLNFWSVEYMNHTTNDSELEKINVAKTKEKIPSDQIYCRSKTALMERLKQVGYYFYSLSERCHIEWIWDGFSLWIVQKDTEVNIMGTKPGSNWKIKEVEIDVSNLQVLKLNNKCQFEWDKIDKPKIFLECGLPSVNIYVLEDPVSIEKLYNNQEILELNQDLEALIKYPIVIRTSLKKDEQIQQKLYLPRTDTIFASEDAKQFIRNTINEFVNTNKLMFSDFSFLIHHFILSKSCALAYAIPGAPRVRIDSSWGLADGLAYNGYDSFEVDLKKKEITKKIRGKHEYLDVDEKGNWIIKKSGSHWDWGHSLEDIEALEIAEMSLKIVTNQSKPAIIMFFINYPSSRIHSHILPWHIVNEIPSFENISEGMFNRKKLYISTKDDFDVIKRKLAKGYFKNDKLTMHLKFEPSILRDTAFIKEIGSVAIDNDFHVELEGSTLSHAYYILSKLGVKVRCDDLFNPKYEKQEHNKLVRDKIPERISSHGETAVISRIPPKILIDLLKSKAVEESLELNSAVQTESISEELADILEIVKSLSKAINMPFEKIEELSEKKREERGGFEKGIYLRGTEESSITGAKKQEQKQKITPKSFKGQKAKLTDNSVIISLIPSIIKGEPLILHLKELDKYLVIKYQEKEVVITIENKIQDKNPNQLSLFND